MKTDIDFYYEMLEALETDAYDFGAYTEFNGLDVQHLKSVFEQFMNK
jgi:hypothetical protein